MTVALPENLAPNLFLGTSSWSSADWVGPFYPKGTAPAGFLGHYSQHYRTVEIDSTFYHAPGPKLVDGWNAKTPDDFIFSAKVPKLITHERALVGCGEEMRHFVSVMDRLEGKLGALLLQFEYVAKGKDAEEYKTGNKFRARLEPFLEQLPADHSYVVEVRNEHWLGPKLLELLAKHKVALALTDYFTMPPVAVLLEKVEPLSASFLYVRFLGHHKQMDKLVKEAQERGERTSEWSEVAVDRTREMSAWVPALKDLVKRKLPSYAYFNNHYAGYAPGSIELFRKVWLGA